ncbi:MAG: PC4/YdbC family ssDNA-binding protein [Candidatus Pacearchaeota archaeon]|nr:PC4/YdbC family ssDNA-binding protein [Candidatus Pacearchaeota archaeon]
MERDIARISKNSDTDIVVRIDDFGGKIGVTIREFVKSDRYTGFTKAGTRISADNFSAFKQAINSIDESELMELQGKLSNGQTNLSSEESSGKKSVKKEKITSIEEKEF